MAKFNVIGSGIEGYNVAIWTLGNSKNAVEKMKNDAENEDFFSYPEGCTINYFNGWFFSDVNGIFTLSYNNQDFIETNDISHILNAIYMETEGKCLPLTAINSL